jgi:hypothetical protein
VRLTFAMCVGLVMSVLMAAVAVRLVVISIRVSTVLM